MNINEKIEYDWPYEWEHMPKPAPIVNRLLKAMIEKDVEEMKRLFSRGATIKEIDKSTFKRAMFHLLEEYSVIECLIKHGFVGFYGDYEYYQECIEPLSYSWGLLARAWYIGNYEVFELLAKNGFNNLKFCSDGEEYYVEELIMKNNDMKALMILMENGYSRSEFLNRKYTKNYLNCRVIQYLYSHPVIYRKTIMLDKFIFKDIPAPQLEKPGIFNRKRIQQENKLLMEDYRDRVNTQERFKKQIGIQKWKQIKDRIEYSDKVYGEVLKEVYGLK